MKKKDIRLKMKSRWNRVKDEIKKFHEISSFKEKGYYIWDYYRLWITGIVVAVTVGSIGIHHMITVPRENWIYVMFANTFADIGNESEFYNDFVDYTKYNLKEKKIEFNNSAYFDYSKNVVGNHYYEAFVTYAEAGTLDAITMEKENLTALGESGRLLDLNSEKCSNLREKYKERMVYCKPYDESYSTEPVPVGIDISDSILMDQYHIYADSCVLGIGAKTTHLEEIEDFLAYVLDER